MYTAAEICLLASRIAKGGTGMVGLSGQFLNLTLEDLKLNRDLKVNRVTQTLNVTAGTNGPFALEADYLRTYDMFFPLQGPNGMTQFLTPITIEQYDEEWKSPSVSNYPYEFATDLSTQAQTATATVTPSGTVGSVTVTNPGYNYTSIPAVALTGGGGSGATAVAHMGFAFGGIIIGGGGLGYQVGDLLTIIGGTVGTHASRILVTGIGGGGVVTNIFIYDPGDYVVLPGFGPSLATTGGHGTGMQFGLLAALVSSVVVVNAGANYTSAPAVGFSGGGGSGATATSALLAGSTVLGAGVLYIYPQSSGALAITHRYMRDQPDLVNPETSTEVPWFPFQQYLIHQVAALMMGVSGDDRQATFLTQAEAMLKPHLIMEGDEQKTVRAVTLDPRHFKSNRGLRPTKVNPY